ncbi:hypothetical protein ILUMI_05517 [Ignelater luminosus]|uniref:leucine--tRNA ligase n=1 Tax=Ignelater luminosus TaxID=2038154 RepID=A0A8K0DAY1_IGNLU|nr:hypothetical protein ILUMI_05517 [Ignelater luminosus]
MKSCVKCTRLFNNIYKHRPHVTFRSITGLQAWNEELSTDLKHKIEDHWSSRLISPAYNENDTSREKYYVLSMFPYPSGHLHMGHVRVYTISDAVARFQRMNNKNVIHPIGWDAFGLPAENAAIERNVAPEDWTKENIQHMKLQLKQLGCSFEWDRELATCDSEYYKWTQELFLKLYDAGLVYQKEAVVNWDPIDKTVLADEQVDENGCSWRSGAKVEHKLLKQWFIRATRFSKDLLEGLDDPILQDWRDIIKIQKHWIGECNGVLFDFDLLKDSKQIDFITLWTSTPEYIEHCNFVAVSPNNTLAKSEGEILEDGTKKLFIHAKNPINNESVPIFVTDQIEFLDRTDSYLGIPGIVEQDQVFCDKFKIQYRPINLLNEQEIEKKRRLVCKKAQALQVGGYWSSAKLRNWLISRQRYWGTPIPMIHCEKCGTLPVPRTDLPVRLPKLNNKSSQKRISNLNDSLEWLNTVCPKCKGPAKRETDTMDTFVDSSWYYLRYLDRDYKEDMFNIEKAKKMMPVDLYIGGKEHATLHLYYARFVSHFLHSLGLIPEREPFKRLLVQGMVMGRSYRIKGTGQYVPESQVKVIDSKRNKAVHKETNQPVVMSWEKMSKSKHNGVDPSEMLKEYGIDTTRLLILADVAPTSQRNWNSNTFPGIINWQRRLWLTIQEFINHRNSFPKEISTEEFKKLDDYLYDSRNFYVKGATFNYCTSQQLSVAVSKMQGLTNSLRKVPPALFAYSLQFERALACQLILLAPMAPHFASELWSGFTSAPHRLNTDSEIQWDKTVLEQKWPIVDKDHKLDLVCQVNGVETMAIKIPKWEIEKLSKDQAMNLALEQKEVQEKLITRNVVDSEYTFYKEYEGVINIITVQKVRRKVGEN